MDLDEARKILGRYSKEDIKYSGHAEIRLLQREVSKELIEKELLNPVNLIAVEQEPSERGNIKLKLVFSHSRNKTLIIVAAAGEKTLNIVTPIMRYRKWYDKVKKWQKKR